MVTTLLCSVHLFFRKHKLQSCHVTTNTGAVLYSLFKVLFIQYEVEY